jgi:predicted DNA-binding transcriptional regulator AlpA
VSLPSKLLRFRDLKRIGLIENWPTLKRRIESQGFPPGKLLGPNTRVWTEAEVEVWFVSRPEQLEDPPPENGKPAPSTAMEGSGPVTAKAGNLSKPTDRRIEPACQASSTGEEAA